MSDRDAPWEYVRAPLEGGVRVEASRKLDLVCNTCSVYSRRTGVQRAEMSHKIIRIKKQKTKKRV